MKICAKKNKPSSVSVWVLVEKCIFFMRNKKV